MNEGSAVQKRRYTVAEVNRYLKRLIKVDSLLSDISVCGEISNFKRHYSGHLYFTLKDSESLIKCVMFKSSAERLRFRPEDGMKIVASGAVSVFERDGTYQLYCTGMEPDGIGSLMMAYEQLKSRLAAEGLFDTALKRRLPMLPSAIVAITSSTGAVIRDIINVSVRRFPGIHIRLLPVAVQGNGAAAQIAYAIRRANELKLGDVIIVGRGGGSLEDLWPFNEEIVARAIRASGIPVVSAVGHETDFTICDFAADLRAPTPSAAAELCVPDYNELFHDALSSRDRLNKVMTERLKYENAIIAGFSSNKLLASPDEYINRQRMLLDASVKRLENNIQQKYLSYRNSFSASAAALSALNPYSVLLRGYTSVTRFDENRPTISAAKLSPGDRITVRFKDGRALCDVKEIINEQYTGKL